jgi:hypothetical protein
MKNKIFSCLLVIFLLPGFSSKSQTIEVIGSINTNTAWDADTVKIIGDVTVESDVLLSISPGVYIEAQGYYRLTVLGNIHAIGSPNDTIIFSVNDTTGFWSDTTSVAGGWNGIYIIGEEGSADSSIFKYCKIQYGKNYDEYGGDINGGALYVYNHGFLHINHCLFENNMAICYTYGVGGPFGGAVYCENVAEVLIDSSSFVRNRSFDQGGAIRIGKNCYNTVITHNAFINNAGFFRKEFSGGYAIGGGGAAVSTSDLVYSPEISNNFCFNNIGLNGIIYTSNLHARIFNNVICNNWGCGIADGHQLSTSKTFNNTIVNNKTMYGGIRLSSKAEVYNNIIWGNIYYPGINYNQIYFGNNNPTLKYNCVQYGDGGPGAIFDYPEFVNPTEGVGLEYDGASADWTLVNWSYCINAGTPDTSFLTIPDYDILGNTRIFGNRIDMGAFENQEVWAFTYEPALIEENVSIFPNPASTIVTIKINNLSACNSCTLSIFDFLGRELYSAGISANEQSLKVNVASWKSGLYSVVVTSSNAVLSKTKLIVN